MKPSIMGYQSTLMKDGSVRIDESSGENICTKEAEKIFVFLLEDWDQPERGLRFAKVCWNLDEFLAPILRLLPHSILKELAGDSHRTYFDKFKLFYIRNKVFGVTYGRWEANIYGLSQYFGDSEKPDNAYEVAGYGEELIKGLAKMGLFNPKKLTSAVAIYEECMLGHMSVPTVYDMPDFEKNKECVVYAIKCLDREWRSCFQIGYWDEVYDYDIISCYPSIARGLRNTKFCKYEKSDKYITDADWGFLKGEVIIDADISPILSFDGERQVAKKGKWEDILTKADVDYIRKRGLGKFRMENGWFMTFTSGSLPLKNAVDKLFGYRYGSELTDTLSKQTSVGLVGKMSEEHENRYGNYFNPMWASYVQALARLKVADFIYDNKLEENLIAVMVDGIVADRKVAVNNKKEMGEWRLNKPMPALVLSIGYQFVGDKKPGGIDYETLMAMMLKHPKQGYYPIKTKHKTTLWEALESGDLNSLGLARDFERSVDLLTLNPDRRFGKLPKTGGQVLNRVFKSKAMEVGK